MGYLGFLRRGWVLATVLAVAVALLATAGTIVAVHLLRKPPPPTEAAVHRYGFYDDGGARWAPESGQLKIEDGAGRHRVSIGLRFRTQQEIDQLDGDALEFRLTVRTSTCQAGWASTARTPRVNGLPKKAKSYVAVGAGDNCGDTLVRMGSLKPGKLEPGHEYTLTADLAAEQGKAVAAHLDVAKRPVLGCSDKPSCVAGTVAGNGPDVESLVGDGWPYAGTGCRRWFAAANTSFPCLPDQGARIMTLGDSITTGVIGDHSWRYWAWRKLAAASDPDWTGANKLTWSGEYAVPSKDWNSRHDAQAGWSAYMFVPKVTKLVEAERPDVLLIDLGTNDVHPLAGKTAAQTAASLDQIVGKAQAADPDVQIMLAQPAGHHDVALTVMADLAGRIANIAATRTTNRSLVTAVDLRSGWDRDTDTWDGTHPTEAGELFIAKRFIDRLASADAFGRQFGPLPVPDLPGTPEGLRAAAQSGAILLSWNRVAQASEYRIYLRDVTLGGDFQLAGSGSRSLEWGRKGLIPGHAYEYYVTAMSGGKESKPTRIGRITAA